MKYRKIISTIIVFISVGLLLFPSNFTTYGYSNLEKYNLEINSESDFIIKKHEVWINLKSLEENYIEEKFDINNPNNITISSINLWFNLYVENMTINDGEVDLHFEIVEVEGSHNNVTVYFRNDMQFNSNLTLYAYYSFSESPFHEMGKDYYLFQFKSSIIYFTEKYTLSATLPYGFIIHYERDLEPIIPPSNTELLRDRIFLEWVFSDIEPVQDQVISVFIDLIDKSSPIWAFIVGPVLGILTGIIGSFLYMRRRQRRTMKRLGDVFLTDTQKELVNIILNNDGRILQKELYEKTGYSKSNISRTLIPLEEKGFIKKEKKGRNYIIYLTEKGYKVSE